MKLLVSICLGIVLMAVELTGSADGIVAAPLRGLHSSAFPRLVNKQEYLTSAVLPNQEEMIPRCKEGKFSRITKLIRRKKKEITTESWSKFSKRPLQRGWILTIMTLRILIARFRAKRKENRGFTERAIEIRSHAGKKLAECLIMLGPTYVKLGQIASSRKELQGTEWAKALERLQDNVPPFDWPTAKTCIEQEYGYKLEDIFESFETKPIAAASLGQVYRAQVRLDSPILQNTSYTQQKIQNPQVAVKVQRPYLAEIYARDTKLLRRVAGIADRFGSRFKTKGKNASSDLRWLDLCDESVRILYREIDYVLEAENGAKFAQLFKPYEAWLASPQVYSAKTKCLVMEYMPTISLKKLDEIQKMGFDTKSLAAALARAYLLQFGKFRMFNTDPHAGNLGVDDNGRLVIYDFGQVSTLSKNQSVGILKVIDSIVDLDAEACLEAFRQMGVLKHEVDDKRILKVLQKNFDTGKVRSRISSAKRALNATANSTSDNDAQIMQYFQLPATYAFVARAISQLTGVATNLDPQFEFIEAVAPLMYEVQDDYFISLMQKRIKKLQHHLTSFFPFFDYSNHKHKANDRQPSFFASSPPALPSISFSSTPSSHHYVVEGSAKGR